MAKIGYFIAVVTADFLPFPILGQFLLLLTRYTISQTYDGNIS
jgi:hypothetical protein